MEPGIFTVVFQRDNLEATLDAVAAHGVRQVQFDLASAGLTSLPAEIPPGLTDRIRRETEKRGIRIAAVSGTYNMAHPDPRVRADGLARLRVIAEACRGMGTSVVTLCTGTRDPDNMWRRRPDNDSPEAWRDLLDGLAAALTFAEERGVTLAFEPEPANVVNSIARARALLDELRSPRLGVVLDAANTIDTDEMRPPRDVLAAAVEAFGDRVVVAHAKDHDAAGRVVAAGQGIVPWDDFVALLGDARFDAPLILHGLGEGEAAGAIGFLRGLLIDRGAGPEANVLGRT